MNKLILCAVLWAAAAKQMNACNVCACSSMGNSLGIMPQFRSHFVGIRHTARQYQSRHPGTYLSPEGRLTETNYLNSELWGRFSPFKRLQVFGFLPYNIYNRTEFGKTEKLKGFGDPSVLVNYVLMNTPDSSGKIIKHALLIGGGIKMGFGAFNSENEAGFQLGSGSHDALLNASYTLRYKSVGFLSEGFLRVNTENANQYRYGDKFTGSARLFMLKTYKRTSWLPWAGASYERSASDKLRGKDQQYTGGSITYSSFGLDVFAGKFQFGCNTQIPLIQNLGEGLITENSRISLFLIYHFSANAKCK